MTERRLVVVRHAKAEPHQSADHGRQLTEAGRRAALDVGRWLAEAGLVPDYALVSSATRTRQTWAGLAESWAAAVPTEFTDGLYHAGPEDVIEAIRWVPLDAGTVVYVGHNPTAGELPHLLDDGTGDRAVLAEIASGYPTAAAAVLDVGGPWSELAMGRARVTAWYVGARD